MRRLAASRRYILFLYAVLLLFYGGWAALWLTAPQTYTRLLGIWDVLPVRPQGLPATASPMPFFDLEGVISWSECARKGIDVYRVNPCDPAPYNRVANYSPLLVDLPLEWIGVRHSIPAGLLLDGLFLLILPLVFRPRSPLEFAVAALACLSHATVYAVERANIDVAVFALIAAAALIGQRTLRGRLWLYGAVLITALAKYYPIVLGVTALRERPRVLLAVAAVFAAAMGLFAWRYWPELLRATRNLPYFHKFSDMFGAGALPSVTAAILGLPYWTVRIIKLACLVPFAWLVWRFTARLDRAAPRIDWNGTDQLMLLCGSLTIVGCFLLQTNNSYRAIFLMLAIPGLLLLARRLPAMGPTLRWAVWGALGCLWAEVIRAPFAHWPGAVRSLFLVREVMWWFEAAVLSAVIACFVVQSPAWQRVRLARL